MPKSITPILEYANEKNPQNKLCMYQRMTFFDIIYPK